MLHAIQTLLSELYDLSSPLNIEEFVCGPEVVRATLGIDEPVERGELVVVFEDEQGVHVGLYLAPDVLDAVRNQQGYAPERLEAFRAMCLATEGVSHVLYLAFRADFDESVTQLELELQAEVDKYAAPLLAGNGAGAIAARSRALRERLFERVRFLDPADTVEGERYRVVHRAAARYTAWLEAEYIHSGRVSELWVELRRFYRLGGRQKLRRTRLP